MLPTPETATTYLATATWESYTLGERQVATTTRTLQVALQPLAHGAVLTIAASPPTYRATTALPLVEVARQLAALYAQVELLLTPTGEVAALLNYAALRQAGEHLLAGLQAAALPSDQLTATLLAFASRQLASPEALLGSLQFDYLYQALLAGLVAPAAAVEKRPARQFAGFFDKTPLWFAEQASVVEAAAATRLLHLHGPLDAQRTDLAAVQAQQAKAAQLAAPGRAPSSLPAPHFCYEATYSLGLAAGLPLGFDLTVYARAGQLLNKEYHLRLERI